MFNLKRKTDLVWRIIGCKLTILLTPPLTQLFKVYFLAFVDMLQSSRQ